MAKNGGEAPRQIMDIQMFQQFPLFADELRHRTSSSRNFVSLPFQGVQELPDWMSYATLASVLMCTSPGWVGLCILWLFQQFKSNLILVRPGTEAIGTFISFSFREYVECPNPILYVSCTSIWSRGGPGLLVGLEVKLWNCDLDWISTMMCASPWLSSTLLMSRSSSSSYPLFLTIIKSLGSNWFSKQLVEEHNNEFTVFETCLSIAPCGCGCIHERHVPISEVACSCAAS
jgi:hypothetical protein